MTPAVVGEQGRRYRILGVLGEGGFGRVYKARLEDPQGFVKDVAIKVVDPGAGETTLKRFRDEARILGLVRDRAVVTVEPPVRLGQHWAVIMEYVEGNTLQQLLARRSRVPPRVALQVVQEVARALDSVYEAPGAEGEPLRLIHRDLKPANLQITRGGEVKILDFGLARACFGHREADTSTHIGGTLGYIAPERVEGIEGPAGDIYSLGILLRTLVTGVGPRRWRSFTIEGSTATDANVVMARGFAGEMIEMEPSDRPTARQVEAQCAKLAATMQGPTLREWAQRHIEPGLTEVEDGLVGGVLSETLAAVRLEDSRNLLARRRMVLAATFGTVGSAALVLVVLVAIALATWSLRSSRVGPVRVPPTPDVADFLTEPEPVEAPTPAPVARPRVRTPPAVVEWPVAFDSDPPGAEVWVDGAKVGVTPLAATMIPEGDHTLRFVWGFEETEYDISVREGGAKRYVWEVGEPLQVHF